MLLFISHSISHSIAAPKMELAHDGGNRYRDEERESEPCTKGKSVKKIKTQTTRKTRNRERVKKKSTRVFAQHKCHTFSL